MKKYKTQVISIILSASMLLSACLIVSCDTTQASTGIGILDDFISTFTGDLVGNSYYISEYDNFGNKLASAYGEKVKIKSELDSHGGESSYLDITIDGYQWHHVGNTMIFAQEGLEMVDGIEIPNEFGGLWQMSKGLMCVDGFVNEVMNFAGKSRVIVVYSQLGQPIGIFTGDSCTVTIPTELPKMTRVNIDGKSLYIHRANVDIYDKWLLEV